MPKAHEDPRPRTVVDGLPSRLSECIGTTLKPTGHDLALAARRLLFLQTICPHRNRIAAHGCAPACEDCGKVLGTLDPRHAAERLARLRDHQNEHKED